LRKVFTDELPRRGKLINWKESISYIIKFIYDNIKGEVEICGYDGKYLSIKYLDNKPFEIKTDNFMYCKIGKLLGKHTIEFKINIGEKFKDNKRDIIIIDKEYRYRNKKNSYTEKDKWYKYKCNICGYDEGWLSESNILTKKRGCGCCHSNRKAILGFNTIWDTDRWMVDLGVSENDAKTYSRCSNVKIYPICPDCKELKGKGITLCNIYGHQSISCSCGDGISYPEKIMHSVLKQLNISFNHGIGFKWLKNKLYDFYIADKSIIIEINGLQHYEKSGFSRTLEEEQVNDKLKEEYAIENKIKKENYIKIDCRKSNLEFIKKNILESNLNTLYDLSNIDWIKCHKFALSNLIKEACNYKKENVNLTTIEIGKIMNLSKGTISRYLKQGNELGWCCYNVEEESRKGRSKSGKMNKKLVEMFKDGISLGIFESREEIEKCSLEKLGVRLLRQDISNVCIGRKLSYKGYTFKYI